MKKLALLCLVLTTVFFSCNNDDEKPNSLENNYTITFKHSGDSDKFIFTVATITDGGNGWKFENGEDTNPGFNDLGLTTQYLQENNPTTVQTKSKLKSFTLQYNVIFLPTFDTPASLTGTFEIRKNGELVDTAVYTVTDEQEGTASFTKEYK